MKKFVKSLIRLLIQVIVVTVLIVGIRICTNGMYLLGLPDLEEIQSVRISYPGVAEDVKTVSSPEEIELALKLTGFLKYDVFAKADSEQQPFITMTYQLKDGTDRTVSANDTTVWWNNKAYPIKDREIFIRLTAGIFFPEDLQAA